MASLRPLLSPVSSALTLLLFACGESATESVLDVSDTSPDAWSAGAKADGDGDSYDESVDCDDTNAAVNPGASETDNLVDDDCDDYVDENFVSAGDIILTEINKRSQAGTGATTNNASWVEVYNTSSRTVSLANWTFVRGTTSSNTSIRVDPAAAPVLAAGERAVFCDSDDFEGSSTAAYPLDCDYVWGDESQSSTYQSTYHNNVFYLRRDNDSIGLYINGTISTGTLIDSVTYSTAGSWPNNGRLSVSLDPAYYSAVANDSATAWCVTTATATGYAVSSTWRWFDATTSFLDDYGTPGAENYDCPIDPDLDGDTYVGVDDCDDTDPAVNPAASEVCDGVDNDCNGVVDDGSGYLDSDNDGYGDPDVPVTCGGSGGVPNDDDCDDADGTVNPDAVESDNGADDDCDGWSDEDFVGTGDLIISEINKRTVNGGTAVDNDASWVEVYNTSARDIDLSNWHFSRGSSSSGNDIYIDPAQALVVASGDYAVLCDSNDFEAQAGNAFPLVCDYYWGDESQAAGYSGTYHDNTMYLRRDSDTVSLRVEGDFTSGRVVDAVSYATGWPNYVRYSLSLDSDSLSSTANDSSGGWCMTTANSAGVPSTNNSYRWYNPTGTKDEFGTPGAANYDCIDDTDGDTYNSTVDCDDSDATVNPGATESCDGIDNDCDTLIDESGTPLTWYADVDSDTFGDAAATTASCAQPTGYVTDATDCDDADGTVNPGETEVCGNGVDDDCDPDPTACEFSGSQLIKTDLDFRAYGTSANYAVGSSVSNNGDLNDDGYDDVVVGQALWDQGTSTDNGKIYVWYGPVDTSDSLTTFDLSMTGSTSQTADYFGSAARFAGDVDGDLQDDLLAGAYMAGSTNTGAAYLFYGGTSATSVSDADATFTHASGNAYAGYSFDGGDADGDGQSEVVVSAYGALTAVGQVGVWNGTGVGGAETFASTATALISGSTTAGNFGYSVAVGDLDGDDMVDLLVGAPATASTSTPGALYIFTGFDALAGAVSVSSAFSTISGSTNADRFGYAVSFIGDSDGDGTNEFIVSADKHDGSAVDAGSAYVISGAPSGASTGAALADTLIRGEVTGDFFGRTVAGVGDSNNDSYADVMIGATSYDWFDGSTTWSGAGAAYFFYGPLASGTISASTYDAQFTGANTADAVGAALQGGGDVNADGYSDWMGGATSWDGFGLGNSGGSWLFYGEGE